MATEKIYIAIDGEKIEATGEVLENLLAEIAEMKARQEAEEAAILAKAATKAAVAERLGLSADELAALLG